MATKLGGPKFNWAVPLTINSPPGLLSVTAKRVGLGAPPARGVRNRYCRVAVPSMPLLKSNSRAQVWPGWPTQLTNDSIEKLVSPPGPEGNAAGGNDTYLGRGRLDGSPAPLSSTSAEPWGVPGPVTRGPEAGPTE